MRGPRSCDEMMDVPELGAAEKQACASWWMRVAQNHPKILSLVLAEPSSLRSGAAVAAPLHPSLLRAFAEPASVAADHLPCLNPSLGLLVVWRRRVFGRLPWGGEGCLGAETVDRVGWMPVPLLWVRDGQGDEEWDLEEEVSLGVLILLMDDRTVGPRAQGSSGGRTPMKDQKSVKGQYTMKDGGTHLLALEVVIHVW